jgi:hypothetical protein
MTSALTNPTDLEGLRQALVPLDPDRRLKPLGTKRIVISATAHLEVAATVREALGERNTNAPPVVVILTDKTPIWRAGKRLSALVETSIDRSYEPAPRSHAYYAAIFESYRNIYPGLKSTFHLIAEAAT